MWAKYRKVTNFPDYRDRLFMSVSPPVHVWAWALIERFYLRPVSYKDTDVPPRYSKFNGFLEIRSRTDIRTGVVPAVLRAAGGPERSVAVLIALGTPKPHFKSGSASPLIYTTSTRTGPRARAPSLWHRLGGILPRCARATAQKHHFPKSLTL